MTSHPVGWRPSHAGDALRRRYGPAWLRLFRKRDRSGWFLSVELRLDATDAAEAAALGEAVAGTWLQAHQAERQGAA